METEVFFIITRRKILAIFLIAAVLTISFSLVVSGEEHSSVTVFLEGENTELEGCLINGTTYVPIRAFVKLMSKSSRIVWNNDCSTANISGVGIRISAKADSIYLEANGRYLGGPKNILIGGSLYVPIRSIAKAFDANVSWNSEAGSVHIKKGSGKIEHGRDFYNRRDLYWLSRIIHAESCGEPLEGKIAVGNVVLNRVNSKEFPDTIRAVIFQKYKDIYQFTPVKNKSIYNEPSEESIIAAKLCLDGYSLSRDIQYFIRESIATSTWVCDTRTFEFTVGNHDFYS
ncbi:MAG: copper amine oxidase [Ruminococcaceae bacterium]|nr:copper amine oxidase [Oscillospiraceae bacterium]